MHLYVGDHVVVWSLSKSARRVWCWDSVCPPTFLFHQPAFFSFPFSVTFSFTSSHLESCGLVSIFHFHSHSFTLPFPYSHDFPLYISHFSTSLKLLYCPYVSISPLFLFYLIPFLLNIIWRFYYGRSPIKLISLWSIGTYFSFNVFRLHFPNTLVWLRHVVYTILVSFYSCLHEIIHPFSLFGSSFQCFSHFPLPSFSLSHFFVSLPFTFLCRSSFFLPYCRIIVLLLLFITFLFSVATFLHSSRALHIISPVSIASIG